MNSPYVRHLPEHTRSHIRFSIASREALDPTSVDCHTGDPCHEIRSKRDLRTTLRNREDTVI
jgi:hypothetical protein